MKTKFYLPLIIAMLFTFSHTLLAQEFDPPIDTQALNEADNESGVNKKKVEATNEAMSIREMKALEEENKQREKEALQAEREAKNEAKAALKLERQIKRTERAEMKARKARDQADQQTLKTQEAIDNYLQEQ